MTAIARQIPIAAPTIASFRRAAAEDLLTLALLHDRELDRGLVLSLWEHCYEDFLGLRLQGRRGSEALALLREGLTDLPTDLGSETLDRLAADYADIYLTYGLRASPCESVWLDQDNLRLQAPMFRVRDWYRRHGVTVEDWRKRSDDHLVHQLRFLSHLIGTEGGRVDLTEAAGFMDEHLLQWIDRFAERVASRCATRVYAGLALLTAAYLDELRDLIADLLGTPRPLPEALATPIAQETSPGPDPGRHREPGASHFPQAVPGW